MLVFENSNHLGREVTGFYLFNNAARAPVGTLSAQYVNADLFGQLGSHVHAVVKVGFGHFI